MVCLTSLPGMFRPMYFFKRCLLNSDWWNILNYMFVFVFVFSFGYNTSRRGNWIVGIKTQHTWLLVHNKLYLTHMWKGFFSGESIKYLCGLYCTLASVKEVLVLFCTLVHMRRCTASLCQLPNICKRLITYLCMYHFLKMVMCGDGQSAQLSPVFNLFVKKKRPCNCFVIK